MKRLLPFLCGIIVAFVLFGTGTKLTAGSPRTVLIEEATQWNCPPCAANNPIYEHYLSTKDLKTIIPVSYHAWWPGANNDAMHLNDVEMNTTRINYYGFPQIGVPICRVNGGYQGNPGDTSLIQFSADSVLGTTSPYTITINETRTGLTSNIEVNVSSDIAINGLKLRVVAVEFHHYYATAGTNGEKDFYTIARKMLPSAAGTVVNIAAGGSQKYTFTYDINATWNFEKMHVVAFLQNDNNLSVLQAASNIPDPRKAIVTIDKPFDKIANSSQMEKTVTIKNPNNEDMDFNLSFGFGPTYTTQGTGWTANISQTSVNIKAGGTADVKVSINSGASAAFCIGTVVADPVSIYPAFKSSASLNVLAANVKHVYFFGTTSGAGPIAQSFLGLNGYASTATFVPLNLDAIESYKSQLETFIFANDYQGMGVFGGTSQFTTNLNNDIKSLLDEGKKVLITSEFDLSLARLTGTLQNNVLYNDILDISSTSNAGRVQNNTLYFFTIQGANGDPIGNGINYTGNNSYNQNTYPYYIFVTDYIDINSGSKAIPFFTYDNTANIAAVRMSNANGGKIVYMTFGLEGLGNVTERTNLLQKIYNWFYTADGVTETTADGSFVIKATPNPANESSNISFTLNGNEPKPVEMSLMDINGNKVSGIFNGNVIPGAGSQVLNTTAIPSGKYFIVVNVKGQRLELPLVVVH